MLVTAEELAVYMDIQRFSNRQEEVANLVIAGLQSEIEVILRRPVTVDTYVEEYRVAEDYLNGRASYFPMANSDFPYPAPPYMLVLDNSPVVTITQVRAKNYPQDGAWVIHTYGVDYSPRKWGVDLYRVNPNDIVEVTYTGGLDGPGIPFLKLSILRAASRELVNQIDDVVSIKGLQANDTPQIQTGFSEMEIKLLQRWKRKQPAWS